MCTQCMYMLTAPRDDPDGLSVVLAARFSIYLSIYLQTSYACRSMTAYE